MAHQVDRFAALRGDGNGPRDTSLEKVWDVESTTAKGVLYVGH